METPKTGYQVQSYDVPVKRYCQTLDLRDSPELIADIGKDIARRKLARNPSRDPGVGDSGNGNLYLGNTTVYDCRNSP